MESDEAKWRAALQGRSAEWVKAKLRERPGGPDDEVFDIVFTGRHPTRAFCQRWCAEQDNRFFALSPTGKATLVVAILLLAFIIKGFIAWHAPVVPSNAGAAVGGGGPAHGAAGGGTATNGNKSSVPRAATSTPPQASSLCGYMNYPSARCSSN